MCNTRPITAKRRRLGNNLAMMIAAMAVAAITLPLKAHDDDSTDTPHQGGNTRAELSGTDDYIFNGEDRQRVCAAGNSGNDVSIVISRTDTALTFSGHRVALFWRTGNATCKDIPELRDDLLSRDEIDVASPVTQRQSYRIRADASGLSAFTERDILEKLDPVGCAEPSNDAAIESVTTLCLVADAETSVDNWNNTWDLGELFAILHFRLDTVAPAKPDVPTAIEKDGVVEVNAGYAQNAPDDLGEWVVHLINLTESPDALGGADGCTAWSASRFPRSATLSLTGLTNGHTYALCVRAVDTAGNVGVASDTITVNPRNECDFAECYPDEGIEHGLCTSGPAPAHLGVLFLVWLLARPRRRPTEN